MSFYLELQKASHIQRDVNGIPFAWRGGRVVQSFHNPNEFLDYVREHRSELKNTVAFTGSASLIASANAYLSSELKKVV